MELLAYINQIRIIPFSLTEETPSVDVYAAELRLIFLLYGQCTFIAAGRRETLHVMDSALVPRGESYRMELLGATMVGVYVEVPAVLASLMESRGFRFGAQLLEYGSDFVFLRAGGRMEGLMRILADERDAPAHYARLALVEMVFSELQRSLGVVPKEQGAQGYGEAEKSQLIKGVVAYINENYRDDIHLDSIAKRFWISPSYLSRQFKNKLGVNITYFILERKIYAAQVLLLNSDQRVFEVAAATGFKSVTYFNTVFRKITGLSPSEYRKDKALRPITGPTTQGIWREDQR